MFGVWGKGLSAEKNVTLAFVKKGHGKKCKGHIKVTGVSAYKIFTDGKFIGYGPCRAAKGYSRIDEYAVEYTEALVVEIAGYNIVSFYHIKENPFFWCEGIIDGIDFTHNDFKCYRLPDRVQKVQRYSYQRTFAEAYTMTCDRSALYAGNPNFEEIETEAAVANKFLKRHVSYPDLQEIRAGNAIESGHAVYDKNLPIWKDRAIYEIGNAIDGFYYDELEIFVTDDISKLRYYKGGKGDINYYAYSFERVYTGFPSVSFTAHSDCEIVLIFDEIIFAEEENQRYSGALNISFYRNTCSNVLRWNVKKGTYNVQSFEPYSMKYAKIIVMGEADIANLKIYSFENPDCGACKIAVSDYKAEAILEAARNTLAQNAVDVLTDCPSRERAGWLSDGYFSSVAERLFTGKNLVEDNFLENYSMCHTENLPKGMIPMCYPANTYDMFIPNWAMWYILQICKNYRLYKNEELLFSSRNNVMGIMKYFQRFENSDGLLENLEGWVFIEWSKANEYVAGVNYPSNMCYYRVLKDVAEMYGIREFGEKAERVKTEILKQSFNGTFFEDNAIRVNGKLKRTGNITETCQYYAFWFEVANAQSYQELFKQLADNFGYYRSDNYLPQIGRPNAIYGIYMRIDILIREGYLEKAYHECLGYFYKMAERTGTLWENNDVSASLNHGFASYMAKSLIRILAGWENGNLYNNFLGIDCNFVLPCGTAIAVKEGKRTVTSV